MILPPEVDPVPRIRLQIHPICGCGNVRRGQIRRLRGLGPPNIWSQSRTGTCINFHIFEEVRNPDRQGVVLY